MPLNTKIQLRKGTSSEWSSANPILALGEPGFDSTNNQIRIGDGTSTWNNLPVIGAQGVQGIQGIQGEQGTQGIQGEQGIQGIQGLDGTQGTQGAQGTPGYTNFRGEYNSLTTYYFGDSVSYNGSSFVVYYNSGSVYNIDPTNTSYWQLVAAQGIQGIQGESVQGVQGEQGIQGLDGIQGYDGLQGIQGEQGIQGLDGIQGTQGESIQGTQGIQGSTGTAGNNGSQGTQGIQGNIGTAAGLNWLFSTNTNATDPGAGYFKFNAATAAATTAIYISTTDNAGGSRIAFLNSLDDSTDPSVKGILAFTQFQGVSLNQFQVTGTVTNNTGWFTIPVTFLAGGFTYANNASFFLSYLRSGNQGSQGVQGIQGTTGSFPVISNATDNRLLTSDGTSSGINAESNLTFNGTLLSVTGSGSFSSNLTLSNQTANTIASFDSNKNIVSFSMNGYASGIADADDWAARVVSNGGSVSSSTMSAVYAFCVAIASAGIRDRFLRLNLFCGTGLASCLVPLYRGRSRTGTQLGNTIDTNVNFVSGDYVETGATGGLKGLRTANKRLETGVSPSQVNGFNFHASAYEIAFSDTTYDETMGAWNTAASAGFAMGTSDLITKYEMTVVNNAIQVTPTALNGTLGHFIGSQTGNRVGYLLHPGGQLITSYVGGANLISDWSTVTWDIPIFALQSSAGTFVNYSSARLGGYSFGLSLTAAQANAYYAAMQSFQQALGRNP